MSDEVIYFSLAFGQMAKNRKTIILSDNARALQFVCDNMMSEYKTNVVGTRAGQKLLEKKAKEIPFIGADYLLGDGVADAVKRVYQVTAAFFAQ